MGYELPILEGTRRGTGVWKLEKAVTAIRGENPAPVRVALSGLTLDATSFDEAQAWARKRSIACDIEQKGLRYLRCWQVVPEALGDGRPRGRAIDEVTLAFSPEHRLMAIDLLHRGLKGEEGDRILGALFRRLSSRLGKPERGGGEPPAPGYLIGAPLRTYVMEYRYRDYVAKVTATHLPWSGGIVLRERYLAGGEAL